MITFSFIDLSLYIKFCVRREMSFHHQSHTSMTSSATEAESMLTDDTELDPVEDIKLHEIESAQQDIIHRSEANPDIVAPLRTSSKLTPDMNNIVTSNNANRTAELYANEVNHLNNSQLLYSSSSQSVISRSKSTRVPQISSNPVSLSSSSYHQLQQQDNIHHMYKTQIDSLRPIQNINPLANQR